MKVPVYLFDDEIKETEGSPKTDQSIYQYGGFDFVWSHFYHIDKDDRAAYDAALSKADGLVGGAVVMVDMRLGVTLSAEERELLYEVIRAALDGLAERTVLVGFQSLEECIGKQGFEDGMLLVVKLLMNRKWDGVIALTSALVV